MRIISFVFLLCSFFSYGSSVFNRDQLQVPLDYSGLRVRSTYQISTPQKSRSIPLNFLFIDEDSHPGQASMKSLMKEVNQVFSQCGVSFSPVTVKLTEGAKKDFSNVQDIFVFAKYLNENALPRPSVFVPRSYANQSIGFAQVDNQLQKYRTGDSKGVAFVQGWLFSKGLQKVAYTISHELMHALAGAQHVADPQNLMYPSMRAGSRLNTEQCSKI